MSQREEQLSNRRKKKERRTAKKIIENRFEMCHIECHMLAWNTVLTSPANYMCSCLFVCEWTIYDNVGIVWNMGEFPQNTTWNSCTRHVYKLTSCAGRRRTVNASAPARAHPNKNQSISACMRCVESANDMEQGSNGERRRNINKSQLIAFDSVRIYRLLINAFACVRFSSFCLLRREVKQRHSLEHWSGIEVVDMQHIDSIGQTDFTAFIT